VAEEANVINKIVMADKSIDTTEADEANGADLAKKDESSKVIKVN
jgi:hypothetical protein